MDIVGIAWQAPARFMDVETAGQNGDPIPARLAVPNDVVSSCFNCGTWKLRVRRPNFLEASDLRRRFLKPSQQNRQVTVDAVDVVGGDLNQTPVEIASAPGGKGSISSAGTLPTGYRSSSQTT